MAFVTEDFTGSSGTDLTSHSANWKSDTSPTQRIELDGSGKANRVAGVGGSPRYWNEAVTPSSADYEVSADISFDGSGGNTVGVTGRHSNSAVTFYYGRGFDNSAAYQLYRVVTGSFTLLGSGNHSSTNASTTKTVVLRMEGSSIKVVVDGSDVITDTDSGITAAGFPGLSSFNSGASDQWDNFSASYLTSGTDVTPGVGSITLTGYAPTVTNSTPTSVTVNTDVGALTLTGYAPTVVVPILVNPGVGSLAITGYAPDVAVTLSVATGVGGLTLAGLAPTLTVTENRFTQPGAGALSITGYAPTVGVSQSTATDVGALTITGYAPTVVETPASPVIPVGAAELLLNGYPPIVVNSGDRREQGAGKPSKQGKRRRIVIGDKTYDVLERDIPALLEAVLTDRKPPRTAEVVEQVKPKRRKRRGDDASPVELPPMPDGPTPEDIAQRVELMQAQLQAQAQADMLRMLDRVAERISLELQDEEDAVLALLLA